MLLKTNPGAEHIKTRAKAGFTNHKRPRGFPGGEAFGEMIGVQKYMLGLCAPIATGEIDVIKRCCVGAPSFQVKVGVVNAASGGKAFGRWVTQLSIKIKVVKN
ncbi:hypothetical protein HSBAA_11090 [Vreelandella sulfidaeris]|uniref:Uncharacterized protein n=1 Tax=Vreelandella sulfidaeris TaxID=115553 RepID=A0A455U3N9_9GAMM|nr:hypothetical protein HSBAA_11090 [Halomonas sulfidaeris]